MEINNRLNSTKILSPKKKAARKAGFRNSKVYKWICPMSLSPLALKSRRVGGVYFCHPL